MNRDPILNTIYGPQRLSRLIRYYRTMARTPTPCTGPSNRAIAYARLRSLIQEVRHAA